MHRLTRVEAVNEASSIQDFLSRIMRWMYFVRHLVEYIYRGWIRSNNVLENRLRKQLITTMMKIDTIISEENHWHIK